MSAIARVLVERGYRVTGSDQNLSPLAVSLRDQGVHVAIGHHAQNVGDADLVVISSAIPEGNVELQEAKARDIPVMKRSEFLGQLTLGKFIIAIAGTHGKTTTTAMIAWILTQLEQDPSFIIGGVLRNLKTNAHAGKGRTFVIEADEYDRMFLGLRPDIAVITNIEHDHPDYYPHFEDFLDAFVEFSGHVNPEGVMIINGDDDGARKMLAKIQFDTNRIFTFGSCTSSNDFCIDNIVVNKYGCYSCNVLMNSGAGTWQNLVELTLKVPGKHNILNALAALIVIHRLGLSLEKATSALSEFLGTGRRFEVRGEARGIQVIDDYAHHPTEIKAVLSAARTRYPDRDLWVVWQPHTYSRTRMLSEEFILAFGNADHLLVTKIYPSRESQPSDGFSAENVIRLMDHPDVHFIPELAQVTEYLLTHLKRDDVLLVLSAGDANQISTQVLTNLNEKEYSHV